MTKGQCGSLCLHCEELFHPLLLAGLSAHIGSFGKCDDATQSSANNQVAAQYVMHQPGDGHTLFVGPESAFIVNPTLYPDLRYKLTDFMPSP